jgi:hypothetical protein
MGSVFRRLLRFVGGLLGSSWLRLRAALGVSWFPFLAQRCRCDVSNRERYQA